MAVDTRDRRASVLGLALASLLVLPEPGTLDQPDRQHVSYCYRGIQADVSNPEPGDLITSENAYFARTATMRSGVFGRELTSETITFARDVTTQDTER